MSGVCNFVMLLIAATIKRFKSTANNQEKYLYLYCLAQKMFFLAGTIQHTPTNNIATITHQLYSQDQVFSKSNQGCRWSLQRSLN